MIPVPLWFYEWLPPALRGFYVPLSRVPNWRRQGGG